MYVWTLVLENGMEGQRAFAMNAMRQAFTDDPLGPTLWRTFRAYSLVLGLLLIFAGSVDVVLAAVRAPPATMRAIGLLATLFWTVTFVPIAFVDPVSIPLVACLLSVPLHGLAFFTADYEVRTGRADR